MRADFMSSFYDRRAVVWSGRIILIVLCAAVLSAGIYARFHEITYQGMDEGDNVVYHQIGKQWLGGRTDNFWQDMYYRPVVYALNAAAIYCFGDTDYALKSFNGIVDTLNIALIFAICAQISRSVLPGIGAALAYAVAAFVVAMCRSGMPHTLSTFFVLLAVFAFRPTPRVNTVHWTRLFTDAAAGISLGLATHTHGELAALGFGFVACQAVQCLGDGFSVRAFGRFVVRAGVLTLGFLSVFGAGVLIFGWKKVSTVLSNEINISAFAPGYVEKSPLYTIPYRTLTITSELGWLTPYWLPALFLLPIAGWLIRRIVSKADVPRCAWIPWALVLSNILGFTFVIHGFDLTHPRVFLPVVPLIFIAAFCALYFVSLTLPRPGWPIPVAGLAAALVVATPNFFPKEKYFSESQWYTRSTARACYDLVGDKVDENNRLLIIPSTAYLNRAFQMNLYFGKHAQFLREQKRTDVYTATTLSRLVRNGNFQYFYMSNHLDLRFLDPAWHFGRAPEPWLNGPAYDMDIEDRAILEFVKADRVHLLAEGDFGRLYSRRKRPLFPNSMFEEGTLNHWTTRGFAGIFELSKSSRQSNPYFIDTRVSTKHPKPPPKDVRIAGSLVSPEFIIEDNVIGFNLAGRGNPERVHVALEVAGTELRALPEGDTLTLGQWDVAPYRGQRARILVRDLAPHRANGIAVEGFYYVY